MGVPIFLWILSAVFWRHTVVFVAGFAGVIFISAADLSIPGSTDYWSGQAMAQDDLDPVFDSIEALSKAKLQAGNRVKLVKAMLKDGDISASDHRRIVALYDEARAEVNSGIDRLLVELDTKGTLDGEEPFERIASRAAKHVEEFVAESDRVVFGPDRGTVEAGLNLAESLVNAFVDVWKTLRGERAMRHEKLVERLDALRWPTFGEI